MGTPRHTIELNGHLYDALTGTILTTASKEPAAKKTVKNQGQVLDGFTRRKSIEVKVASPAAQTKAAAKPKTVKPAAKQVQKSRTLMRHAVRKPASGAKTASPLLTAPSHHVPQPRLTRAHHVGRSQLISRFGAPTGRIAPKIAALPVQSAPTVAEFVAPLNLEHHPVPVEHARLHSTASSLEQAIHRATSHQQPRIKKTSGHTKAVHKAARKLKVSPRTVHLASGLAAVLLIAGFFVYQNIPNLNMRMASARAGIAASLPGYQPAGFGLKGAIEYSPGLIKLSYKSHTDDRAFSLVQATSDWTNQALLDNFVASSKRSYQTFESHGKTIYILDGGSATWVDRGIWYQVEGNSALSSDQLVRLASSI